MKAYWDYHFEAEGLNKKAQRYYESKKKDKKLNSAIKSKNIKQLMQCLDEEQ